MIKFFIIHSIIRQRYSLKSKVFVRKIKKTRVLVLCGSLHKDIRTVRSVSVQRKIMGPLVIFEAENDISEN